MANTVKMAFDPEGIRLSLDKILPLKRIDANVQNNHPFKRILASIREIGLIEPLCVFPNKDRPGTYILLDGHFRLAAVRELGHVDAPCLIATEDEAYTYNHKVNVVSPIQEHFMILKAIENGVSEERIARALDVDVSSIRQKRDLLKGICREAIELLKDKSVSPGSLREMRRVKPMRQIEMAELMIASHTFHTYYAKCLFAATPAAEVLETEKPKDVKGLKPEDMARMENEMETLGRDFKMIEESHGKNVLHLVLAGAYLRKLLDNAAVVRFLSTRYGDLSVEFQKILESASLEGNG